jgi:toxin ParE1/3/4
MLQCGMTARARPRTRTCIGRHSAIARALKNPESFTRVRRNPTVRRVLTRRFPYRVFFIVRPDAIVIFAVLHAARHDRAWKQRAKQE